MPQVARRVRETLTALLPTERMRPFTPWVSRGLREGIVTTRYPSRPDGYGDKWRGAVAVLPPGSRVDDEGATALCPTSAIAEIDTTISLDRGRCILCGRCVEERRDLFAFESGAELAARSRRALVVPAKVEDERALSQMRADLARRVRAFRRSIHIRHVDAGSDGADEWEIAALTNPVYDVQRLGIFFTATPRHADILLVTGAGAAGMAGPLRRTFEGMPDPKAVVAAGTDGVSGGLVSPGYATRGGIGELVPVDIFVPGSPPSPFSLLHGILLAVGLLPHRGHP
jgi:Ni,Fe-hydrogenase III small subunit/ferredoxin